MEIMAPVISLMADVVAAFAESFLLCIFSWTASTTTIASSTTIPMANTKAKSVKRLTEKPKIPIKKKVPKIDTGTAIAGIKVALKS